MDWGELVKALGPAAGAIASGGQHGAFLRGYQREQSRIAEEQRRKEEETQRKKAAGANASFEILQRLNSIDDPVDFERFRNLAVTHAGDLGYDPADFASATFPQERADVKQLKELSALLDGLKGQGYDLDELASSGSAVETKDGRHVPVRDALNLTRRRPTDASGAAIAPPKKQDVAATTDYSRFLARYAREKGKAVADLTSAEELDAKKQYGQSDDPTKAPPKGDFTSQYLDNLVTLWREANPGKEPPASVMATLMRQTKKDINQADDKAPGPERGRFSIQQVTKADGTTALIRVNQDTGEASPITLPDGVSGAGRANESERKGGEFLTRTIASSKNADAFEKTLAKLGPQLDAQLPTLLRSEQGQLYRQAQDEFINAGLRDESGAAIQPSEYDRYRGIYFMVPGDTAATLARKREARQRVISGLRVKAGNLGKEVAPKAPTAPPGWKYVPKDGGGWTAVEAK